jgi:hypothetical protein
MGDLALPLCRPMTDDGTILGEETPSCGRGTLGDWFDP